MKAALPGVQDGNRPKIRGRPRLTHRNGITPTPPLRFPFGRARYWRVRQKGANVGSILLLGALKYSFHTPTGLEGMRGTC